MATIAAYYLREEAEKCAAGHHHFGGWREDDDGRLYWMCARGCGHQHRNDPETSEEVTNEVGCWPYREHVERIERAQRRSAQTEGEGEGEA